MSILDTIVAHKMEEVSLRKREFPASEFFGMEYFKKRTRSLANSLEEHPPFAVIAEIKRSSPSAGSINTVIDPSIVASSYEMNGAAGISVLTDARFFGGTIHDLHLVRDHVSIPVLRKEFIIDEYQVLEAKAFGADAILLIAGILSPSQLADLHAAACAIGLESLVELYDISELGKIDFNTMKLIGINNRDLRTMKIDLERTFLMAQHLPPDVLVVSESGIHTAADVRCLMAGNIRAGLIGEHLMKSGNPGDALHRLLSDGAN